MRKKRAREAGKVAITGGRVVWCIGPKQGTKTGKIKECEMIFLTRESVFVKVSAAGG